MDKVCHIHTRPSEVKGGTGSPAAESQPLGARSVSGKCSKYPSCQAAPGTPPTLTLTAEPLPAYRSAQILLIIFLVLICSAEGDLGWPQTPHLADTDRELLTHPHATSQGPGLHTEAASHFHWGLSFVFKNYVYMCMCVSVCMCV